MTALVVALVLLAWIGVALICTGLWSLWATAVKGGGER